MMEIKKYLLPPTALMPNSPYPLLHYPRFLSKECQQSPNQAATKCYDLFAANGWETQWIYRYGQTQEAHYHHEAHECMVVLTGSATIRFGVGDTSPDMDENTYGPAKEDGGIEVHADAGDVFVLPAGTAHKTYDAKPAASFQLLTPGDGHGIEAEDAKAVLSAIHLSGFTMIGSYVVGGGRWSFKVGGDDVGNYEGIWSLPIPERDPVLGDSAEGVKGLWRELT